ncbi:MAG: YicC family protein [Crocinitomicaceae bacterium]|nr:YicC family protein [Crocinitomicaceae bacterium]
MDLKFSQFFFDGNLNVLHAAHSVKVRPSSAHRVYLSLHKIPLMIYSMTGYGKASARIGLRRYTAELRSLNGKQLDLGVRMPSAFRAKEMDLRKHLGKAVGRGKCDLSLHYAVEGAEPRELNKPLIEAYVSELSQLAADQGFSGKDNSLLAMAMRLPDVIQQPNDEVDEDEWKAIEALVGEAVDQFIRFRKEEGKSLEADFNQRIRSIQSLKDAVEPLLHARVQRIRDRIESNFKELQDKGRLDENRFEQEMLFYMEKLDVSEELVRLTAHCEHFLDVMNQAPGQGKKLGFIAQEIGREINTLGSKANDADMQRIVVQMKDELEKIKEQVLNAL